MRRLTVPVLITLLVLLLGATAFGIAQLNEVKKLRDSLAALDAERAALRKRLWDLQKLNSDLAAQLDRGRTARAAALAEGDADGDGPAGNGARSGRGGPRGAGGRFGAAFNSPEVQKLMALQQKAGLDGRYASLFKQLNLSPADLDKFKNLLVEKQSAVMDVMAAARAEGLDPRSNRDEIRQLVQNSQADVDNTIKATLGDAAFAQYKDYETTLPQRSVVDQLGQRLSYSTTPLTDAQSQQLVQILASNAPVSSGNNRTGTGASIVQAFAGGGGPGQFASALTGSGARITDAAVAQAQGVLAPTQVAALQSLQAEQQAAAQLAQQMRANFENRSTGNATPTASGTTATPRPGGG